MTNNAQKTKEQIMMEINGLKTANSFRKLVLGDRLTAEEVELCVKTIKELHVSKAELCKELGVRMEAAVEVEKVWIALLEGNFSGTPISGVDTDTLKQLENDINQTEDRIYDLEEQAGLGWTAPMIRNVKRKVRAEEVAMRGLTENEKSRAREARIKEIEAKSRLMHARMVSNYNREVSLCCEDRSVWKLMHGLDLLTEDVACLLRVETKQLRDIDLRLMQGLSLGYNTIVGRSREYAQILYKLVNKNKLTKHEVMILLDKNEKEYQMLKESLDSIYGNNP